MAAPGRRPPRTTAPRPDSRRRTDPARGVAFDVLRAVAERDAYANLLLPALLRERGLSGRDAALATELAYGTLRGQGSYDAIIAVCSDRELDRLDPPLLEVLRLGAHQLLATRIAAHAAVATSVDLAKDVAGPRPAGFVNAVLRRVADGGVAALSDLDGPRLDTPEWLWTSWGDNAREIALAHQGELTASHRDGARGVVFTLTLPALPRSQNGEPH